MQMRLKSRSMFIGTLIAFVAALTLIPKPSLTAPAPSPDNLQLSGAGATFPYSIYF